MVLCLLYAFCYPFAMSQPRLIQLDLLRAVAIFLVLGNHMVPAPPQLNIYINKLTTFWFYGGWVGVDLFFVLSGFLVSGLLFREYMTHEKLNLKRFLIRRGLKIYPSFYVLIATTVIFAPFFAKEIPLRNLFAEIFFVQNFFGKLWPHTWSLAVEEHFYIGLAILFFLFLKFQSQKKNPFRAIPYFFVIFAVLCLTLRALMAIYKGTSIGLTFFRIDALFFGVLISYFWNFYSLGENLFLRRNKNWLILLGILLLLPPFFFRSVINPWFFVFGMTTNYIAGGLLLVGCLTTEFKNKGVARIIAGIGTYSYSIYLWHLPVQYWVVKPLLTKLGMNNWFFYAGFYLLGAIVVGVILSKTIEYPILKIRDKYFPRRSLAA